MSVYVDSSVLLRGILGQPRVLPNWDAITAPFSSVLLEVECLRALDRLRINQVYQDEEFAEKREVILRALKVFTLVDITTSILRRASVSLPVAMGSLDAIHLATALQWSEERGQPLTLATHDRVLAIAARVSGLEVIGVEP